MSLIIDDVSGAAAVGEAKGLFASGRRAPSAKLVDCGAKRVCATVSSVP